MDFDTKLTKMKNNSYQCKDWMANSCIWYKK